MFGDFLRMGGDFKKKAVAESVNVRQPTQFFGNFMEITDQLKICQKVFYF